MHWTAEAKAQRLQEMRKLRIIGGWNRWELAQHFGISSTQVDRDLEAIRKEIDEENKKDYQKIEDFRNDAREREFQVRRLAWHEYMKSKVKRVACRSCDDDTQSKCKVCKGDGVIEIEVPGNPAFLAVVCRCDEALREIDGVDVPTRHEVESIVGSFNLEQFIREQVKLKESGEYVDPRERIKLEMEKRRQELEKKLASDAEQIQTILDNGEQRVLSIGIQAMPEDNGSEEKHNLNN